MKQVALGRFSRLRRAPLVRRARTVGWSLYGVVSVGSVEPHWCDLRDETFVFELFVCFSRLRRAPLVRHLSEAGRTNVNGASFSRLRRAPLV